MAKMFRALVALLIFICTPIAFAAEYRWTKPGADPCNPKAGCTLAWALEQTKWPTDVKNHFAYAVASEPHTAYDVVEGWRGWMTWGKHQRKFKRNTVAAWGLGHTEPARLWQKAHGGEVYYLIHVTKCGNWGGWKKEGVHIVQSPPPPAPRTRRPLGNIPLTVCP